MSKHTVTVSLGDEDYAQLKELAEDQDRYINEQARHMLRGSLAAYAEPDIRKFTGIVVPEAPPLDTHMAGAGSAPDTSPDAHGRMTGAQHTLPEEELGHSPPKEPLPG